MSDAVGTRCILRPPGGNSCRPSGGIRLLEGTGFRLLRARAPVARRAAALARGAGRSCASRAAVAAGRAANRRRAAVADWRDDPVAAGRGEAALLCAACRGPPALKFETGGGQTTPGRPVFFGAAGPRHFIRPPRPRDCRPCPRVFSEPPWSRRSLGAPAGAARPGRRSPTWPALIVHFAVRGRTVDLQAGSGRATARGAPQVAEEKRPSSPLWDPGACRCHASPFWAARLAVSGVRLHAPLDRPRASRID